MRYQTARFYWSIVAAVFATLLLVEAGEVRVSFLNDTVALNGTIALLTTNGCSKEAISAFRRLVENHYAEEFEFDRSKFPKTDSGFYRFNSISNLVQALPHRLSDTKHFYGLNCFDMMILIADGRLQIGLRPDENYGPFIVSQQLTNGSETIRFAATPRDAFSIGYAEWYRDATEPFFPEASRNARISLVAGIYRWHALPLSTTSATMQREVWTALKSDWRRTGLKFPAGFQVVLYHVASVEMDTANTQHAGLLFSRNIGFTYLEKAGGRGPFVRLDFDDKSDLNAWMSAVFSEDQRQKLHLFATFNDTEIINLNPR
jgi:hypothetical protein